MRGHFTLCLLCELQIFRLFCFGENCYQPHRPLRASSHQDVPEHTTTDCGLLLAKGKDPQ